MERIYKSYIEKYMNRKISLISGPRQCGKTTLSKMLKLENDYLNFDNEDHREILWDKSWNRSQEQIIFDELHKMKNWKRWLKGVIDTEKIPPALTVTGSAKMDIFKKAGDSLAGRYFGYRIHPLDLRELFLLNPKISIKDTLDKLVAIGGFPEPFIENDLTFYNRWKKTHLDIILKQDLLFQDDVRDISSLELLVNMLQKRVGSPISYSSLAKDLQCSDKTIKRWLGILENMYVIFKITPFHKNIARSNLKQPKYYFYDNARVKGDEGSKLENLVATSLIKECHFRQDCLGENFELYYLAKNGGSEIDFAIAEEEQIKYMVEVKTSDNNFSKNFSLFKKDLPKAKAVQLVKNLKREKTFPDGSIVTSLGDWLCTWD